MQATDLRAHTRTHWKPWASTPCRKLSGAWWATWAMWWIHVALVLQQEVPPVDEFGAVPCAFHAFAARTSLQLALGMGCVPRQYAGAALAGAEQQMVGAPGTFIVFDGARLLHRGGMVQAGERVALQVDL